jgi:hypothetical protein
MLKACLVVIASAFVFRGVFDLATDNNSVKFIIAWSGGIIGAFLYSHYQTPKECRPTLLRAILHDIGI